MMKTLSDINDRSRSKMYISNFSHLNLHSFSVFRGPNLYSLFVQLYSILHLTKKLNMRIVSLDDGDGVVASGVQHVVQETPFPGAGVEHEDIIVEVCS